MRAEDVRRHAGTPLTTPVYPLRFTRFTDREYFNVVYRTDPEALRAVVPEPLEIDEPPPAEKPTTPIRSAPCSRRRRISVRNARRGAGCRTFSGYHLLVMLRHLNQVHSHEPAKGPVRALCHPQLQEITDAVSDMCRFTISHRVTPSASPRPHLR
jgi:hypothetical protein